MLRELGVYFDEDTRAAVLGAALAGHDQAGRARDLAARLYADTPARDVDVEASLARLRAAVAAADPAVDATAEPARLLAAAWRRRLPLDPWDVLVVGAQFLPMSRDGWAPALGDAPARRAAAPIDRPRERGDVDVLQ